ncbi:Ig-like domain-containing protein [Patulibacter sp. SYSU D01012]|uniref:Ig-like domain-containing protein n=1 Tax=Patulibacter sp. SYSU D01012 TaxID=2817381 RepID=UPI001B30036D|nr:Ig-like domain-containing protein [Patulibacter sp. SYSU D01012]
MRNLAPRPCAAIAAVLGSLVVTASAGAATLAVDDDRVDCPAAPYTSIQAAVDAAAPGDTVTVCAGDYAEGTGAVGTNALTIRKPLTIKGAGADLVRISPKASGVAGGRILEDAPDIRNGVGDIVAVVGAPTKPIAVDISGVTVDGHDADDTPIAVEAGIVYLDAKGTISRSRVTNVVTSEGDTAYQQVGGYRGTQPGIGIVQTSATRSAPVDGTRTLRIELTRVDKYNRYGVLIDGATNDTPPLVPSGVVNRGELVADQIVGRTQCINYQGTGSCGSRGIVDSLTTGPLFGQDGVRVTAGARAQISDSLISQNLVNGTGAPVRPAVTPSTTPESTTNNANLTLGAGIRLVGAYLTTQPVSTGLSRTYNTSVTRSNIVDNAYGALNLGLDGTTTNTGTKTNASGAQNLLLAENNWWGLGIYRTTNTGPVISPTGNPQWPENPVGGTGVADSETPAATTSSSVDFYPYRNGVMSDPDAGQFTIADAPMPVDDAAPTDVTVRAGADTVAPGGRLTLTAGAQDDFGVRRVRFYDGATLVGDVTGADLSTTIDVPAGAQCGSTHAYTALVSDSAGQTTRSEPTVVTVACSPATPPPVGMPGPAPVPAPVTAPSIRFATVPKTVSGTTSLDLAVSAGSGVRAVEVRLGGRLVCRSTQAPYACRFRPKGADVGTQALTATVVGADGSTSVVTTTVRVPKLRATVRLRIAKKALSGGRVRRTVRGTVVRPAGVTKAQGCKGTVTVVLRRAGRSFLNQQVKVSRSCTFSRSVTAPRSNQRYTVSARFRGNTVLAATSNSRRFS